MTGTWCLNFKRKVCQNERKKKLSLAMQIFIALVLAIVAGLLLGNHADFAKAYINPFGTIFSIC